MQCPSSACCCCQWRPAITFYAVFLISLALQLATEEYTPVSGDQPDTCKACSAVINGKKYCSQCNGGGSDQASPAPTDGVCSADNNECTRKQDEKCTTCTGSSFMYKGGCYKDSQAPSNTMCETANAGKCIQAVQGYFLPPDADRDNAHQSVIPCGDVEEVLAGNSHKYKGVLHCTRCEEPREASDTTSKAATCTACEDGFFVDSSKGCTPCDGSCKTCEATGDTKCKSCTEETHFLGAASGQAGKCILCGDTSDSTWKGVDGCLKCTTSGKENTPATCTECQTDRYLKDRVGGTAETCETKESCTRTHFPNDNAENKKKCLPCGEITNGGIEHCLECALIEGQVEGVLVTCTKCSIGKKVSPGRKSCVDGCPSNSTDTDSVCVCNDGYSPDDAGASCVSMSTNRSGLSTGVIAGISVAVIVVVGGLVGFLCWWFVCRGKA